MTDGKPPERKTLAELAAVARGEAGYQCPSCGCRDFRVANTWRTASGTIRRLRKCRHCGSPVNSTETFD